MVAVGSTNPSKVSAVEKAYTRFGIDVDARAVDAISGVPPQPTTLEEVVRGAFNRAVNALSLVTDAEEGVGIESGLMRVPILGAYVDVTAAVIVDRGGYATIGLSPAFQIPPSFVDEALRGRDLSSIVRERLGIEDIGRREGLIGLLTNGVVVRRDLNEQAVAMALIPRLNEGIYRSKA